MAETLRTAPRCRAATGEDREELRQFSCEPTAEHEEVVNTLVHKLASRRPTRGERLLVFSHPDNGELVGLVAFSPQTLGKYLQGMLIVVIALAAKYRGSRIADDERSVALAMLAEALDR
ncbi:MAG: hypothetical protein QOG93_1600, partial [Gaiellaceae bacterium]|nr:hypothetical protein [Gaiellaceae bacterium]